jgi:hypothetical protein
MNRQHLIERYRFQKMLRRLQLSAIKKVCSRPPSPRSVANGPQYRRRERVSVSNPSGNFFRNETAMEIPHKQLAIASVNILSKGDPKARALLVEIHRTLGGDDQIFCSWCVIAEKLGLLGPRLNKRHQELGGTICELLVCVLEEGLRSVRNPVALAAGLVLVKKIRERVTW